MRFETGASLLGVLASTVWLWVFAVLMRNRHRLPRLADQSDAEPPGGWPRLAVLIAARDEATEVETAVRSMLDQDYPGLELVAVDDRSTDGTGEILDRLAAEDSRLRVVHIAELPPGWLGKTHALQTAAEAAGSEWILFADGDVWLAPGALRRAVSQVCSRGDDHLAVMPEVPTETVGERLMMTVFGPALYLNSPIWDVDNPDSRAYLGVGAFNLVRAEGFRAIGGFRNLALSVDDDLRLGEALKASGRRSRALVGTGAVRVRWHVGAWGLVRGLEKNLFAGVKYRFVLLVLAVALMLWGGFGPFLGLLVGPPWARGVCAAGVAAICGIVGLLGRPSRVGWYYGLTFPVSVGFLIFALLRSAVLTYARGGVRWRDTFYPLADLRAHQRYRDAWIEGMWRGTR